MPDDAGQDKTEQPTPRRIEKARREGTVARSADLNSAAVLMAGLFALMVFGKQIGDGMMWSFRAVYLSLPSIDLTCDNLPHYFQLGTLFVAKLLAPFMLTVLAVGIMINYVQVGPLFTTKPLVPKFDNMNPVAGLKRLVSAKAWVEVLKGILKVIIVGWIGYLTVKAAVPGFVPLIDQGPAAIAAGITKVALKLAFRVGLAILVIGLADWRFQRWDFIRQLKMTKQEIKDEWKQLEGDPKIKSHIRQVQMKTSLNRMIKKLPTADVVIANPIHVAVALRYDPETMSAPEVVAKGKRKLAERIKSIARDHDIPIVEQPELARALYKTTDVGMQVPYDLYQAVAEVLAMVYRLKEAA